MAESKSPVCPSCGRPTVGVRMEYVGGTGYVAVPHCGNDLVCAAYEALRRGWVHPDERVRALVETLRRKAAA